MKAIMPVLAVCLVVFGCSRQTKPRVTEGNGLSADDELTHSKGDFTS